MSRPTKHPKSGVYQFRKAVPVELRPLVGKTEVKRSLGTKDPAEARVRHAEVAAEVDRDWALLKAEPQRLTMREITALSGLIYKQWMAAHGDDPGPVEIMEALARAHGRAIQHGKIEQWFGSGVDLLLQQQGLKVDEITRAKLLDGVAKAHVQAAEQLIRRASGDFRPDPDADRFPEWNGVATGAKPSSAGMQSLKALVEGWWTEAKALGRKPSTYESYSNTMAAFVAFLGHDDAGRVTPEDVIRFKDHRLASVNPRTGKPISPKTVKDSDLAGLRAVFDWAVINRKMGSNPAKDVTLKVGKVQRKRPVKGFTDAEAEAILKHASSLPRGNQRPKTYAAKRWVPWLCAYTGARVGEIAQLRKEDVREEGGVWIITITPEAGTVKTDEAREVPLHPHLVELGFPEFVRASEKGHLFLTPAKETGDVLGPLQGVKNRLAEFARQVVKDPNVQPNHGWRHRFKTIARDVGMDAGVRDAIQGHDTKSVAESYGDVSIKAKVAALSRHPRYDG